VSPTATKKRKRQRRAPDADATEERSALPRFAAGKKRTGGGAEQPGPRAAGGKRPAPRGGSGKGEGPRGGKSPRAGAWKGKGTFAGAGKYPRAASAQGEEGPRGGAGKLPRAGGTQSEGPRGGTGKHPRASVPKGKGTFAGAGKSPRAGGNQGEGPRAAAGKFARAGGSKNAGPRPGPFERPQRGARPALPARSDERGFERPPPSRPPRNRPLAALPGSDDELDAWSTRPVREPAGRFERRAPKRGLGLADEPGPPDEPGSQGPRRPLSHVGGRVERLEGPPELVEAVRRALSIDPELGVRDHVHGFHSYPARLHPTTAASLITSLTEQRSTVVDPFCGCGTVLVEARRLGRKAVGVDLNPLAVRLSRFKTHPLQLSERDELLLAAARVAEHAEERRLAKTGPTHRYSPALREAFDVHVLLELDGLSHGIKQELPGFLRQSLNLALSSIFSKVGKSSSAEGEAKRLASGFTIRFFESRVGEMVRQLAEYEALLPEKAPGALVREEDSRELGRLELSNVDLFVSSPPYPGVLDYADYHRTRLSWLHMDATRFEELEMGARRHLQRLDHEQAAAAWENDFVKVLGAMRGALARGGYIALVLADSLLAGKPYPADVVVERCARRAGLAVVARGSQRRPHFHRQSAKVFGDRQRYEHLLLLAPG
jgi:hypothetical protein